MSKTNTSTHSVPLFVYQWFPGSPSSTHTVACFPWWRWWSLRLLEEA